MTNDREVVAQSLADQSSKWNRGAAIRSEVLGSEYVSKASQDWAGTSALEDLVVEFAWEASGLARGWTIPLEVC